MKKIVRFLFRLCFFALFIFVGIIAVNTFNFHSQQIPIELIEKMEVDKNALQRLSQAIQIPTVSRAAGIDTMAFRRLHRLMAQAFPLTDSLLSKKTINQFSLLYYWKGKKPKLKPILLMGHLDVVPVEELSRELWENPPYEGRIKDGYIWGRGVLDDKLSVFGILEAVEALLKENYIPERDIYFAFGHDEEISGKNGASKIVEWLQKEQIELEYILDEGALILEQAIDGLEQPLAMIGIAEKGYTTLSLTAQLKRGGHASMPPKKTAVGMLSKAIHTLEKNPFPAKIKGPTADLFRFVGPEMATLQKAIFANLWCTESIIIAQMSQSSTSNAILRTTIAPTILRAGISENVLPTRATAQINCRIFPGETIKSTIDYVQKTINEPQIRVMPLNESSSSNPSAVSNIHSFGFQIIQKSIQQIFPDVVVAPSLVIAATDSRHYQALCPNIFRFTPVQIPKRDLEGIHGINEKLSETNYYQAIRFYKQLILNSSQ